MSVVSNAVTMPAFGAQIASMVEFANACRSAAYSADEVSEKWTDAHDTVVQPFGIEVEGPPRSEGGALGHIWTVTPLVREKFDARAATLLREPLTKGIIVDQSIDTREIKVARDMELISEVPANALIQSARHVYDLRRSTIINSRRTRYQLGCLLALNWVSFFVVMYDAMSRGELLQVPLGIIGMIGNAWLLGNILFRIRSVMKENDGSLKEFRELLKDAEL
jgi:hypothetical protein